MFGTNRRLEYRAYLLIKFPGSFGQATERAFKSPLQIS